MLPANRGFWHKRGLWVVAWAGLTACSLVTPTFNRPSVSAVSVALSSGNLMQQNFALKLTIHNPNDRALPVKSVHAELYIGGVEIASGVSDRAFVVPARSESEFDMTIKANMALALMKLADQMNQHSIDYQISGAANLDLAFLHDLPFHQSGSLALDQIR